MSYLIPADDDKHPAKVARPLMQLPEFAHLIDGDATIDWLYRNHEEIHQGRRVLGTCYMPTVQGRLKDVFDWLLEEKLGRLPDFLIILEWDYWADADARGREILAYHELCHACQKVDRYGAARYDADGHPVWGITGHDVEEFSAVVRRYGTHSPSLQDFMDACNEGNDALMARLGRS